jgi:hypothetical protein
MLRLKIRAGHAFHLDPKKHTDKLTSTTFG